MTSQVLQPKSVYKWYRGRHTVISVHNENDDGFGALQQKEIKAHFNQSGELWCFLNAKTVDTFYAITRFDWQLGRFEPLPNSFMRWHCVELAIQPTHKNTKNDCVFLWQEWSSSAPVSSSEIHPTRRSRHWATATRSARWKGSPLSS